MRVPQQYSLTGRLASVSCDDRVCNPAAYAGSDGLLMAFVMCLLCRCAGSAAVSSVRAASYTHRCKLS